MAIYKAWLRDSYVGEYDAKDEQDARWQVEEDFGFFRGNAEYEPLPPSILTVQSGEKTQTS